MVPSSRRASGPQPVRESQPIPEWQQQQQHTMQNPDLESVPAHSLFVKPRLTALVKSQPLDPYVGPDYIRVQNVKCRRINLQTGATLDPNTRTPDPRSRSFTWPFPYDEMCACLDTIKPWAPGHQLSTGLKKPCAGTRIMGTGSTRMPFISTFTCMCYHQGENKRGLIYNPVSSAVVTGNSVSAMQLRLWVQGDRPAPPEKVSTFGLAGARSTHPRAGRKTLDLL